MLTVIPFQENTIIFRTDSKQCTITKRFMADFQEKHMVFAEKSYIAPNLCGFSDVFLDIL